VQVRDLPSGFYFKAVAKQLGDFIGELVEYDCNQLKGGTQPPSRAIVGESICLRNSQVQAFDLEMFNNMNRVLRVNLDGKKKVVFRSEWDSKEGRAQDLMIHDLEEISVGAIDGKKRQKKNVFFEKVSEISDSKKKESEGYLAYQKTLSMTTKGQVDR
ncbi:hypothetical protein Gorai_007877, partial [Gossypium raimondii]|nr:hypothetical protein [Gossypium raimondii]